MRPIVAYGDIAADPPSERPSGSRPQSSPQGSASRSRNHNASSNRKGKQQARHWDDPNSSKNREESISYNETQREPRSGQKRKREEYKSKSTNQALTHEEIWDDSALVNAWDAAMEEYEALNGPDKGWKAEPRNKSVLWYNPPFKPEDEEEWNEEEDADQTLEEEEEDSHPIDFDSFVPSHNPALNHTLDANGVIPQWNGQPAFSIPMPSATDQIGRDEAFQNALQASYWTGYWTAVYHSQSSDPRQPTPVQRTDDCRSPAGDATDGEAVEHLLPTERDN